MPIDTPAPKRMRLFASCLNAGRSGSVAGPLVFLPLCLGRLGGDSGCYGRFGHHGLRGTMPFCHRPFFGGGDLRLHV